MSKEEKLLLLDLLMRDMRGAFPHHRKDPRLLKVLELSKELSSLEEIVNTYKEYKTVLDGIKDAKEMVNDKELGSFAKEELSKLETSKQELEGKLEILLKSILIMIMIKIL